MKINPILLFKNKIYTKKIFIIIYLKFKAKLSIYLDIFFI